MAQALLGAAAGVDLPSVMRMSGACCPGPELVRAWGVTSQSCGGQVMDYLLLSVQIWLTIGAVRCATLLWHEMCHLAAAMACSVLSSCEQGGVFSKWRSAWFTVCTRENLTAHKPLRWWAQTLVFWARPLFPTEPELPHVMVATGRYASTIRLAGPAGSLSLSVAAAVALLIQISRGAQWGRDQNAILWFTRCVFAVSLWTSLDALVSDVCMQPHHTLGEKERCHGLSSNVEQHSVFFCGNFGALVYWQASRSSRHFLDMVRSMIAVTMLRGGQAGGAVMYVPDAAQPGSMRAVRSRLVNSKRGRLDYKIVRALRWRLALWTLWLKLRRAFAWLTGGLGKRPWRGGAGNGQAEDAELSPGLEDASQGRRSVVLLQGHTRFATSSLLKTRETHPHTWGGREMKRVWVRSCTPGGLYVQVTQNVQNFITHNGDFDFCELFHEDQSVRVVHRWLEMVLGVPNAGTGDSVNIAGLFDLVRTQGLWYESVRLAYCMFVLKSISDVPDFDTMRKVAAVFEREFKAWNDNMLMRSNKPRAARSATGGPDGLEVSMDDVGIDLTIEISALDLMLLISNFGRGLGEQCPEIESEVANALCTASVDYFFRNSTRKAMEWFLERAKGSFGIAVSNSMRRDEIVLAAHGQPMFIGWNGSQSGMECDNTSECMDTVLYGSEVHALEVALLGAGAPGTHQRLTKYFQLADTHGEVFQIARRPDEFEAEARVLCMIEDGHAVKLMYNLRRALHHSSKAKGMADAALEDDGGSMNPKKKQVSNGHQMHPKGSDGSDGSTTDDIPADYGNTLIHLPGSPFLFRAFSLESGAYLTETELLLRTHPFVHQTPSDDDASGSSEKHRTKGTWGQDDVWQDLQDLPGVLKRIESDWDSSAAKAAHSSGGVDLEPPTAVKSAVSNGSVIRELGHAFAALADNHALYQYSTRGLERGLDVLVVGVEVSLWISEQFVADLEVAFPKIRARAWSANKVLGALGTFRDPSGPLGFAHGELPNLTFSMNKKGIVLLVSQSGVTFPTYHAAKILEKAFASRVFVLTSDRTNLISQVVHHRADRVILNHAGARPAEPSSVALVAAHHSLTRVLELFMATAFVRYGGKHDRPFGMAFGASDLQTMRDTRAAFVQNCATYCDAGSDVYAQLKAAGRHFGNHILEPFVSVVLGTIYILVTVGFTGAPASELAKHICGRSLCNANAQRYVAGVVDAVLYIFLPWWTAMLFRLVTRRDMLARLGKRTLVICDMPWVHQALEMYVSKLFALAYGWMSVDVHGANALDHFVHRFTHRVTRGVMLAVGRPDGRLISLTAREAQCLMAALQAKCVQHLRSGPDLITVGHNSYKPSVLERDISVALPTQRKMFMCERMLEIDPAIGMEAKGGTLVPVDSGSGARTGSPMTNVHEIMSKQESVFAKTLTLGKEDESGSNGGAGMRRKSTITEALNLDVLGMMGKTTNRRSLLVRQLETLDAASSSWHHLQGSKHGTDSQLARRGPGTGTTCDGGDAAGGMKLNPVRLADRAGIYESLYPEECRQALQPEIAAADDMRRRDVYVASLARLETNVIILCEGRFFSAERFVGFCLLFHAMARVCSVWWPLDWDIAHSQSYLRVASTACPVSAADVGRVMHRSDGVGKNGTGAYGGGVGSALENASMHWAHPNMSRW
ncbi:hypothetical protein FVE85_0072 [Porphyridium purpureum]|uniref:Glutamine amidotransferase type-2 domain-containing protein n=1 Tax=Porphyridium purpureum TaxID=35688 RepID=A0A5J4Z0I9_PORPP|nr:hypothetical protein FVE85_0072 [Porphyridium purpureum]|eukprot:POR8885..scf208_2